ncbi:uncharacterized protein BJ171DRAFT_470570 [Polychytrium aggregatum]|uniref:uncharacterized protein n=1 Tax=Polychytrium aggregatum TaxID=110093 RepID=UPI0022FEA9B4|nr:uncharacterized protein BJ171DRAFT_470570 [Polychytrium aggregatum]KAI9209608.1 hypothetical protein BJ171DRAFT_470570 [Polychytrium aggregatum]
MSQHSCAPPTEDASLAVRPARPGKPVGDVRAKAPASTLGRVVGSRITHAFVASALLHIIAQRLAVPWVQARAAKALSPGDALYLAQKLPSTVNALVVGLCSSAAIASGLRDGTLFSSTFYSDNLDRAFANQAGFMLYDMCVMALHGRESASVWIHHVFGFLGTFLIRIYKQGAGVPGVFAPSELTVLVSNLLWAARKLPDSSLAAASVQARLLRLRALVFLLIRFPVGPYVIARFGRSLLDPKAPFFTDRPTRPLHSGAKESQQDEILAPLSSVVVFGCFFNTAVFTLLNTSWTIQVLQSLIRTSRSEKPIHHI